MLMIRYADAAAPCLIRFAAIRHAMIRYIATTIFAFTRRGVDVTRRRYDDE